MLCFVDVLSDEDEQQLSENMWTKVDGGGAHTSKLFRQDFISYPQSCLLEGLLAPKKDSRPRLVPCFLVSTRCR